RVDVYCRVFQSSVEKHGVQLGIVLDILLLLSALDLVERWLSNVHVTSFDQLRNLPVKKRKKQGAYMAAIHISVCVVTADATHSPNEILVTLHRKVVHIAAARGSLLDI